jgi:hypothetical protein
MLAHEPTDALVVDLASERFADLRRHPATSVTPFVFLSARGGSARPPQPPPTLRSDLSRLAAALRPLRDSAEQLAHHRNRIQLAVREYPGVLHIDSFAKYAAAFFNISFSIRSRATS